MDNFNSIVSTIESNKSMDEFMLGLGLATLIDSINNPQFYTEQMIRGTMHHINMCLDAWRDKYNEEILDLNENDITS